MSYAEAAAKGPAQSPEEILQHDLEPRTTIDVDSPHISTVTSSWSGETDTQMQRIEREAEEAEEAARRKASKAKSAAEAKAKSAKEKAKQAGHELKENSDNPVVMGNYVVWTAVAAALGFGAYRQSQAGTLTWKVAGTWAGVVGLFAAGDYFFSRYLFQNKYPRK